ncbi:pre-mRNA-splicing factor SYF1 [Plasmodium gonderi]|uniref:Pre-mRNA-splicing factor SYF1 n=1 Tax=Plasmodium gonderi TaxID=77519 RepID=A0A1Y1JV01_PLAGO|nr:pre-mRNA-splicing factor SYF1 [Plasmodium gonderi]GAW83734.1 pre-mRNA-splicing factor SYF1 [Plasmodium gonderi]
MDLYGEMYNCDELLDEFIEESSNEEHYEDETFNPTWKKSMNGIKNPLNDDMINLENEAHVKNIQIDLKSNQQNVSTQYLFLYINTFKEKNIKRCSSLYVLNFYDVHMKNDDKNVLDTDKDFVHHCQTNILREECVRRGESRSGQGRNYGEDEVDEEEARRNERMNKIYLFKIYETILKHFPFSFKLWYHYLKDRIEMLHDIYYDNKEEYEETNRVFDTCLLYMYHFKGIYIMYIQFLFIQRKIQKIRFLFNLAVQNICLNQHEDLWDYQLRYNEKIASKLINYEYVKRYVTIYPEKIIHLFNHYLKYKMCRHALSTFFYILSCDEEENLELGNNITKYDLYKEIFHLISSRKRLNNDIMVTLKKNSDIFKRYENVTSIYILLANTFVYEGRWNKAMDAYEEGISECYTVNDFTTLFEGYIEMMKILIQLKMRKEGKVGNSSCITNCQSQMNHYHMIDLYMDKINYLLDKRKIFIADIKLKNNQKNVYIWLSKIDVVDNDREKIDLYNKCLKYFEENDYVGRLSDVYISYAYFYYNNNAYEKSVQVFNRAIRDKNFKTLNEIASIFCSWIEIELLENNSKQALNISRLCIDIGKGDRRKKWKMTNDSHQNSLPTEMKTDMKNINHDDVTILNANFNLLNNIKLSCLILDMELNYGTIETSINLFDLLYHSKNITVKMVLSFANYLYEHKYYNECFKTYEKAISIFQYPYLYPIYVHYIRKYVDRYKDKNIAYVRELFKQAIYGIDNRTYLPKEFAKFIFLMYAQFEHNYGFLKKSLSIYKEAIPFLPEQDKIKFYKLFISKVSKSYGVHKAREAFEEAIQTLKDDDAREICLSYIDMEYKLNEYERVRALYIYTAQFTNPSVHATFYQDWREFEALYGNEHTFRDMIRIKRSVLSLFSNSRITNKPVEKFENSEMGGIENTKRKLKEIIENEENTQKKMKML